MSRPALLAAGTALHLLVLENDRPSCQAWTVEDAPVDERELWLVGRRQHRDRALEVRYRYAWDAGRLVLTGYTREEQADGALDLGGNGHCEHPAPVIEHPGALEVGGSVWFAHASECEAALADQLPVATDFGACAQSLDLRDDDDDAGAAADAGMRRFDTMMHRGGALYELAPTEAGGLQCERWAVKPRRRDQPAGDLVRVRRHDGGVATTTFGYGWSPAESRPGRGPELILTGPALTYETPEGTNSLAYACAEMAAVSGVGHDVVMLAGNRMYLTGDACERAHQTIQARLRWLPPDGGTPAERMAALAGGGMPGC
jgi:hypothetical protein